MENERIRLQSQMMMSLGWANFWQSYANSPNNKKREVYEGCGYNSRKLTEEELVESAFETAFNHMGKAQESFDQLNQLG